MQNFYWAVRLGPIPVNREGRGIGQKEKLISNVGATEASVDLLRSPGAEMALQRCLNEGYSFQLDSTGRRYILEADTVLLP